MIRLLLDKVEEMARRRAILWLCPDIDQIAEGLLVVDRQLTDASVAVGEQVATGDYSASFREPGRSIYKAEMSLISPILAIQDLRYGRPHGSEGYNAPGRWGEKNRRRHGK